MWAGCLLLTSKKKHTQGPVEWDEEVAGVYERVCVCWSVFLCAEHLSEEIAGIVAC